MKAKIFLRLNSFVGTQPVIPWDYPQMLTAWFYRCLAFYSDLHIEHHTIHRQIRPFALSPIRFPDPVLADVRGIHPSGPWATLTVGAADEGLLAHVRQHAATIPLVLGSAVYQVDAVVLEATSQCPSPWVGRLVSPLVVADRVQGQRVFLRPDQPAFHRLLVNNLAKKARTFFNDSGNAQDVTVTIPTTWQRRLWRLYGRPVIGWETPDTISVQGSQGMIDAVDTLGLGVYNAHGFGATETLGHNGGIVDGETCFDALDLVRC